MSTLFDLGETTGKSAVLSPDGLYRYTLTRGAGHGTDRVNFLMLNPSTADHEIDDPTIRRCLGYARFLGYADMVVTNLFALRSTDPKALRKAVDPVGPDNDRHILEQAKRSGSVVCAWGNDGAIGSRAKSVVDMLVGHGIRLCALRITGQGQPAHPLYLPGGLMTVAYSIPSSEATPS